MTTPLQQVKGGTPRAYYNEIDPHAAAWLRELIKQDLIAPGDVDERSIEDVRPADLAGYSQCHFFAGIGGWSLALRMAGWPDARPVWTGSCPCQPFSAAGKRKGTADARHLWPSFRRVIGECGPAIVFGEQVASKDGRVWLNGVRADLEEMAYAVGSADLCAAGVGSPHIRQRLYWLAHTESVRTWPGESSVEGWSGGGRDRPAIDCASGGVADADGGKPGDGNLQRGREHGQQPPHSVVGAWGEYDCIACTDGKTRRIESGTFPLAHGVPARMVRLRGYGNAIVPQVAAEFIGAFLDITQPTD